MRRKYLRSALIITVFAMMVSLFAVCAFAAEYSDAPVNSENAVIINEGKPVKCTLSQANNFKTVYQVRPSKSGNYKFFCAGTAAEVRGKLYEGIGDTETLSYEEGRDSDYEDPGVFNFTASLNAGTVYTFLIQSKVEDENAVFDVGYCNFDDTPIMASSSEITITEENKYYWIGAYGSELPEADWVISDESVAAFSQSICSSGYNTLRLEARKNGTTTVSLVDNQTGDVLANCKVICKGITEYYDLYVGGVHVSDKNSSSITGDGITGKVSYDKASNTLYLENATLTSAIESEGPVAPPKGSESLKLMKGSGADYPEWGTFSGVINNHTVDTFKIKLTGTNKINNVTLVEQDDGDSNYDASYSYSGVDGICSCGSIEFDGTGSLSIDSSSIGTAVYCARNVTVAEGASLDIKETNSNNANGIVADGAVNVNGKLKVGVETHFFMVSGKKACVTGYGIKTESLTVGSKGSAVLNASTDCEATSYCVMLSYGGSADIGGTLNAKAVGANGEKAGIAICAEDDSEGIIRISGAGKATLQGNDSAVNNIKFEAPILVKAGHSASDVRTIPPLKYNGETYVVVSAPGTCSGGHNLTRIEAKDSTEDEEGNSEYWFCSECGKVFSDSAGKNEISIADTVIQRKPRQDSSLYILSPDNGASYNVGDTISITADSDVYIFTYISGILIEGAPNRIFVRVLKDGQELMNETLLYYEAGQRVGTNFKAESAGKYTIQVSKSSDFSTLRSVEVQVGKISDGQQGSNQNADTVTEEKGADGTPIGKGAAAAAAEKAIKSLKSDSDPKGAEFAPLMLKSTKQTKTSIKLTWKKVKGAKKYVIYGNRCGKSNKPKKLATVKGSSKTIKKAAGKKLKKGTYYKFIVVAIGSNNKVISTSKIIHVATKGGKVRNYTKVTTKAKNSKVTLKKGKTFKLGAKAAGKNVKKHVSLRYESSNPKVAKVSKNGKITAKKKGTCKIYVFAQNGLCKTIKVTVK
ncbi:MAG: Ig-like domain-containing protein [Mogibacterium sp.]|nr:Ig-like domain-containing protein [Mogibacterium sp.]